MVLVRRRDHTERFAGGSPRDVRVDEWRCKEPFDPRDALRGQRERARATTLADRSAGLRGIADERPFGPAFGAARQMREVPREPEQLQLEGEDERIERRLGPARLGAVQDVEKPRQRLEGARVPLLLDEEPEHRLEPDQTDGQAVRVLASLAVRPHERGPGHGRQLSAPLVEHQLDVAQRLEPPAETRLRPPDPLRDRPHAPALERVQVQDAVRLAEPQRAQDDRLRFVPAPRHASSVGTATVGNGWPDARGHDLYDALVRLLHTRQGAPRLARHPLRGDRPRRRPGLPEASLRPHRRLDGPADPRRRQADRRLRRALAARPRGKTRGLGLLANPSRLRRPRARRSGRRAGSESRTATRPRPTTRPHGGPPRDLTDPRRARRRRYRAHPRAPRPSALARAGE